MAGFFVGHGRHWEFFRMAGRSNADLMALFHQIYLQCQANVIFQAGGVQLICEPSKELGVALLMRGNDIRSAFPYAPGGHIWPIEIKSHYEWSEPIEAQLIGSCHGAKIAWFDAHYALNHGRSTSAKGPLNFHVNALAYRVWRTQFDNPEQEAQMGKMKAYMPLTDSEDFVASEDEIQFISHVEEARSLDFHGIPIDVYTVTIALPANFPMRLNVYSPRVAAEGTFGVGDRISGVCWLFGRLASS